MENTVDLRRIVYALSDALDLVGIDDVAHGKRVAIMAAKFGEKLHLPREENLFLFELGLLHDIGVSSTHVHGQLMDEFDWEGSQEHAHLGHSLLRDFTPLERMAWPIYYHHTKWSNLGSVEQQLARQANLILEFFRTLTGSIFSFRESQNKDHGLCCGLCRISRFSQSIFRKGESISRRLHPGE
jgi:hypothetical protein